MRRRPEDSLRGRAIGVYGSAGAPWHHLGLAAAFGAEVRPVRAEDVRAGRLAELDAFVMPGGGATAMHGMLEPLGEAGAMAIRRWVEEGGTYVSSCAGSVLPLALSDEAARALPAAARLRMTDVPLANPGDATLGGLSSPGVGRIRVRVDPAHPLAAGLPETLELVHYNGPFFDLRGQPQAATPFAWPVEALPDFTPAERFLQAHGQGGIPEDALVVTSCIREGAATGIEAAYGAGRIVLFGSHPEFGLGPLALGWGSGSRLLVAALGAADSEMSAVPSRPAQSGAGWAVHAEHPDLTAPELAREAIDLMLRGADRFAGLATRDAGAWLDPDRAPALNGRPARSAWRVDGAFAAAALTAAAEDLAAFADRLGAAELGWLDDAPRADQDFGWMGLVQLLRRMHGMLDGAKRALDQPARHPAHAYDLFDTHPFHLATGTYLSAAGLAAAALMTTVVLAATVGAATREGDLVLWIREDPAVAA